MRLGAYIGPRARELLSKIAETMPAGSQQRDGNVPRIYADHAATTPLRPEVRAAMLPYHESPSNASSQHAEGRRARAALDGARATVAALLGCAAREIVFTGSGSEADNLAIMGAARGRRSPKVHAVTVATEHAAVLRAFGVLAEEGFDVTVLPVDCDGRISPERFVRALGPHTVLASVMLANNETGTVQSVAELAGLARERGVLFHTDAVQAGGRLPVDVGSLNVDLLSLSAHKFYGPQGSGALYVRAGTPLLPLVVGGGQEAGRRSGTVNVAGAVGLAEALRLAVAEQSTEHSRLGLLRDRFESALTERIPRCAINGRGAPRLSNLASVAFEGVDAATLAAALDLEGAAVSAGSACASGATEPSHVLAALGAPAWRLRGTLRFSFGKTTTEEDVERLAWIVEQAVARMRVAEPDMGTSLSGSGAGRSEVHA